MVGLHIHPYFVYGSSEGAYAQLARAFDGRRCDRNQNLEYLRVSTFEKQRTFPNTASGCASTKYSQEKYV